MIRRKERGDKAARRQSRRALKREKKSAKKAQRKERRAARQDMRRARTPKRRLRTWFQNLSVRKAFPAYILFYLAVGTMVCLFLYLLLSMMYDQLRSSYMSDFDQAPEGGNLYISLSDVAAYQRTEDGVLLQVIPLTSTDRFWVGVMSALQILLIPICLLGSVGACSFSFYKRRMRTPIQLLLGASRQIEENNLDFHIEYARHDELGQLCAAFERMRGALLENERAMWRAMEERKRLNAAFSHDLRTPLTVLRGQTDMLRAFLPSGKITPDKALATLDTMSAHIERLEGYVSTMNELQRLEDIELHPQRTTCEEVARSLRASAEVLCREKGLGFSFLCTKPENELDLDAALISRVCDNLLSNALRYASSAVRLHCAAASETFLLCVSDDGPGFSPDALRNATRPFYRGDRRDDAAHFGLGLNICRILCEKHGGSLVLANEEGGGAKISAFFESFSESKKS